MFIQPFRYYLVTMIRCIVLLNKYIFSGMLQTNKRKSMVLKHIQVKLACDGRRHTCHVPFFSSCIQFPDDNAISTSLKSTQVARQIHRLMQFASYSYPSVGIVRREFRLISPNNIFHVCMVHSDVPSLLMCDQAEIPSLDDGFCTPYQGNDSGWC